MGESIVPFSYFFAIETNLPLCIQREGPVFTIPNEMIITKDTVILSNVGSTVVETIYKKFSNGEEYDPAYFEILSVFLLYEKFYNPDSEWKPWLGILSFTIFHFINTDLCSWIDP
jgi:hypothetical protein